MGRWCAPGLLAFGLLSGEASAEITTEKFSTYERDTVELVLSRREETLDLAPVGKRIVGVDVVVLDVIDVRDPAPRFLNWFHVNSADYTATRELLVGVGDHYDPKQVYETERNLRDLREFSVAWIVPIATDEPDTVRLLVIAKDIWSLRLNSNIVFRGGNLELLSIEPSEDNLAGTHRRGAVRFLYEPDLVTVGLRFVEPRLAGTRTRYLADVNVLVNHQTGVVEGSRGTIEYGVPLYWTRQRWAWQARVSWRREVSRRFRGVTLDTFDADVTPGPDPIPWAHDTEQIGGEYRLTRSFGYAVKNDLTVGASAERAAYRAVPAPDALPAAVEEFEREVVPTTQTRNGPFLEWHLYQNQFASVINVETMSLQESFVTGPEVFLRVHPQLRALGSTRDVVGYTGTFAYTHLLGDGIARAYASAALEHDLGRSGALTDTTFQTGARVVTPSLGVARLVFDGTTVHRPHNFSTRLVLLGGDGRLRGYPTGTFLGENTVIANLELRSLPVSLWTLQLAGTLFFDAGDTYFGDAFDPKQSAGFGLRLLIPQLGRSVLRVDWGFAIDPVVPVGPADGLVVTFGRPFLFPTPSASGVQTSPQ